MSLEYHEYEGLNGYNVYDGLRSVNGLVENDLTTRYYMRSLYQRLYAGLSIKCPPLWNENYFKNVFCKRRSSRNQTRT